MIRPHLIVILGIAHVTAVPLYAALPGTDGDSSVLSRVARLQGGLSPKSIVWNGHGLFFAQNMMYRHTVTVFNDQFQKCGTIDDRVVLEDLRICNRKGSYRGAPVECTFTRDGRFAYVSNYQMEGNGFSKPGCDVCTGTDLDGSFIYRINTTTLAVEAAYPTGSVPKFLTLTPDERVLIVANWSSGDVSLIDLENEGCSERIAVGRFPRGLAVDPAGRYAYVALMGGNVIKRIDLHTRMVDHFATVGSAPRHLCMDREGRTLYASLNQEGSIARIDIDTRRVGKLNVGATPRSMAFGQDERTLYVVNYAIDRVTKVDLTTFSVSGTTKTDAKPIGITYDSVNQRIWVACYSGSILVFRDHKEESAEYSTLDLSNNVHDANLGTPNQAPESKPVADMPKVLPVKPVPDLGRKALRRAVQADAVAPIERHGTGYRVIAGSFRDRSNAERQAKQLISVGFEAEIQETENTTGLHQVVAGSFGSADEARQCQGRLLSFSIPSWIKRK